MRTGIALFVVGVCLLGLGVQAYGDEPGAVALVSAVPLQLLSEDSKGQRQYVRLNIANPGKPTKAAVRIESAGQRRVELVSGQNTIDIAVPAIADERVAEVSLAVRGKPAGSATVVLRPVRDWTVYLLPHSHVDIGYTKVQTEVEADQVRFLDDALAESERTKEYPDGSRFKWNSEVMWAVDSYLRAAPSEKRAAFAEAVRGGAIGLDALYGNELTALCRPEELVRLTSYACRVRDELDVPIDTAMISDVPGYTWGIVPVFAQSGVRYFSVGPNRSDRIGTTLSAWGDRPFYWVSPSGQEKVLCWIAAQGYSWFHGKAGSVGDKVVTYLNELEASNYPYDVVQLRYNIGGDNGPPDTTIADTVKDWNAKYVQPKLRIALVRECFADFEQRYGDRIPSFSGDLTPYWEDGAASSARETALNRRAAERLVQAEVLWSLLSPQTYPLDRFREAWRNVILYDEHTWGAHNSISEPDSDFVKAQWDIKQAFAVDADKQSRTLVDDAVQGLRASGTAEGLLVFNTCSFTRSQLVAVPESAGRVGDRVERDGRPVPSQRLANGDLVFVAADVPGLSARRYTVVRGRATAEGAAQIDGTTIRNGSVTAVVNLKDGTISSLTARNISADLVNQAAGPGLNEYLYVPGTDPKGAMRAGRATIEIVDNGPVVATLRVTTSAPSTNGVVREISVVDGMPYLSIGNWIDKHQQRKKEGVHFAFPFNVPDGVVRTSLAWSVMRPEYDQLPGSCKNWITVQRWVDVANQDYGVAWAPIDAPLVELGSPTAESPWITRLEPTQTVLSYVMNNYWHTNYRDSQSGNHLFRYTIMPHGMFDQCAVEQFAVGMTQPFVVIPVEKDATDRAAPLAVSPESVFVTAIKQSEDGKATIVRLANMSGRPVVATLSRPGNDARSVWHSDLTERKGAAVSGGIAIPASGIVTLRIDE
ncbi:MAG: hypothetical protein HUU46_18915 [Candidatus Hydrogenedentes bacterium]|nr:hypothetical protein [Candidatus Hydrogenedentota bacterium]